MLKKVLVIEDDKNINQVICGYLKNDEFEIIYVLDGKQAYDLVCTQESISLITLDIMLPYLSAEELLKIIRENDRTKQTPVIEELELQLKDMKAKEKADRNGNGGFEITPMIVITPICVLEILGGTIYMLFLRKNVTVYTMIVDDGEKKKDYQIEVDF